MTPLFPTQLDSKDEQRLQPYLTCWNKLNGLLMTDPCIPDIQRLVLMEMKGRKRKAIIERLLMRIGRLERERLSAEVYRRMKK